MNANRALPIVALSILALAVPAVVALSAGEPAAAPAASARRPAGIERVRAPAGPPRVDTGRLDRAGRPVQVACSTCHAGASETEVVQTGGQLDAFHQDLTFVHGDLSCLSCHDPNDYDRLRRADGAPVAYPEVMLLCGQCHGAQRRAFEHGAHGGMTGYWDLSRGDRERNGCTDCHDPHAPAYPQVRPVFPPAKEAGHP